MSIHLPTLSPPSQKYSQDTSSAPEITTVSLTPPVIEKLKAWGKKMPQWLSESANNIQTSSALRLEKIEASDLSEAEWHSMMNCAIFAKSVYKGDWRQLFEEKGIPCEWNVLNLADIDEIREKIPSLRPSSKSDGRYLDPETGLVLRVVENPASKEINISFGPTTVGENTGDLMERVFNNKGMSAHQWDANIENVLGTHPLKIHQRALLLTQIIAARFPQHQVTVCGESLGGLIAQIAALGTAAQIPVKAFAFCSPGAGSAVKELIEKNNPMADSSHVTQLWIQGDVVPKLASWCKHVGRLLTLPASENLPEVSTFLPRSFRIHEDFFNSVDEFHAVRGGHAELIKAS